MPVASAQTKGRPAELCTWVQEVLGGEVVLEHLAGGMSTKEFYRVKGAGQQRILALHAPPPEDLARYAHARDLLERAGLRVPATIASAPAHDFALIEDLGDETYLAALRHDPAQRERLYQAAWPCINKLQQIPVASSNLPSFDAAQVDRELALWPQWHAGRHRGRPLDHDEAEDYRRICGMLRQRFTGQPQVVSHRDFHAGNLFVTAGEPAVIDFAGTLVGPHTFDAACLLRDAYVDLDDDFQLDVLVRQWEGARAAGLPVATDFSDHYLDFEFVSLQRMLKVLGQFVRLHAQGVIEAAMLDHLPRCETLAHAIAVRYRDLRPLAVMIEARAT